jgi:CBS domain-containing protein
MAIVHQILKGKGKAAEIASVSPEHKVIDALKVMAGRNIGTVLVLENDKMVGIFSERDYARKVILNGKSSTDTAIRDVMTSNVFTIKTNTSIDDCMELMSEKNIRHLPVVEDDKVIGMISITDLVRFIIEDQKNTIRNLEDYISGR